MKAARPKITVWKSAPKIHSGFEEQMLGMKPEEEREIEVTFPEDYHAEELKGEKATFKIKLHEIKKKWFPTSMMIL